MKIGTISWNFPQDLTLDEIFKMASEIGYEGMELGLYTDDKLSFDSTDEELDQIKESAKKYNIEIYSVFSPIYARYCFTANDEKERSKAKEYLKRHIEIAAYLGAESILVLPGFVSEDVYYEDAYNKSLECMLEMKEYAEKYKVEIALENVTSKFLLSSYEWREYLDKINSKYVGLYFDVANTLECGFPHHWIKMLHNKIQKVHVKDIIVSKDICVDLFEGEVNYPEVLKAFKEVGYDGWITAEMKIFKYHPEQGIINTYQSMRRIVDDYNNL